MQLMMYVHYTGVLHRKKAAAPLKMENIQRDEVPCTFPSRSPIVHLHPLFFMYVTWTAPMHFQVEIEACDG